MTGMDSMTIRANIITLSSVDLVSNNVCGLNTIKIGQNEI